MRYLMPLAVVACLSVPAAAQCVVGVCQVAPVCQVESSPLCAGGCAVTLHRRPVARAAVVAVRAPVVVARRVVVRWQHWRPVRRLAAWRPLRGCCR